MKASYIKRELYNEFKRRIKPQKVLILIGARRVGETELIKDTFLKFSPKSINCKMVMTKTRDNYLLSEP